MNNIAPKEAVEVIKKYRVDGKKMYIQNKVTDDASGLKEVKEKLIELEEINTTASMGTHQNGGSFKLLRY
uniref:Uncharacterized protein n=1 Tax=Rhizophagus irregularis (strain DAOM 181602 / DAOM 197198 / MUCL 43194) TaxID=747089 RepID=U9SXG4_RHIID